MKTKYTYPELKDIEIFSELGFATSVPSGIDDVTEENGSWD